MLPPAAITPSDAAFVADCAVPVCVLVAFHMFTTDWLPPHVHVTFQPVVGAVPVFVTVTFAVKPLPQSLETAYAAVHPAFPVALAVVAVTAFEAAETLPAASVARTV